MVEYDLIIIGSGPGGLTAAIYAARYNLNFIVLGELNGGKMALAHKVCNFPTKNNITGYELTQSMVKHAKELGAVIKQERVNEIKKEENGFILKTDKEEYFAKKIILATGSKELKLGAKGERTFLGKGVSYCATCDAAFFKDKKVAVIGGGDAAVTSALLLAEFANKVYLIYRKGEFTKAEPAWVEQLKKEDKIEVLFNSEVEEIVGKDVVEKIKLKDNSSLDVSGVFVEIGAVPEDIFSKQLNLETKDKYIIVDEKQKTNVEGVFAVGDITNNSLKQIITACGDGATAADSVYKELKKKL